MKILILLALCQDFVYPHAALWDPPSRQTIGKAQPSCNLPIIHSHLFAVYCGGETVVHNDANRGRCGLCGDEFSAPNKELYAGGMYATGTIAKSYLPGEEINVQIKMKANHKGFFSFALCENNDPNTAPTKDCFLKHQLTVNNEDLYYTTAGNGLKEMKVKLPPGLTCKQCILQMTYTAGNNWGVGPQSAEIVSEDCKSKKGKLGCGPQVINRSCSDICIGTFCPKEQCAKVDDVTPVRKQSVSKPIQPYSAPLQPYSAPIQPYSTPIQPYSAPIQPYSGPRPILTYPSVFLQTLQYPVVQLL